MIYDTFIFFNELDLLEIRLNILDLAVNKFVLVEATKTFQGKSKPLFYEENKSRFIKFNKKIIHVVVDEFPTEATTWEREDFQRAAIKRGLIDCNETDLIIVSDLDEIPDPLTIPNFLPKDGIGMFRQKLFYYKLDKKCVEQNCLPWSIITRYDSELDAVKLRKKLIQTQSSILSGVDIADDTLLIEDGGWHFSYLGGAAKIIEKIEAYSHDELNIDKYKNVDNINESIESGRDLFGRDLSYIDVQPKELPKFILDNKEKYYEIGLLGNLNKLGIPYDYQIDLNEDSTAAAVVRLVGKEKSVLELGCAYGAMTKVLVEDQECTVRAIEINSDAAERARVYCEDLIVADLQSINLSKIFEGRKYDVIVASDVIEHLQKPDKLLEQMADRLAPDGYAVISIPNISYNGVIAELLNESFEYRDTGILDKTHVHFFSLKSIAKMLDRTGFYIERIDKKTKTVGVSEFFESWINLPSQLMSTLKTRPDGEVYQYILKIRPKEQMLTVGKDVNSNAMLNSNQLNKTLNSVSEEYQALAERVFNTEKEISDIRKKLENSNRWANELKQTLDDRDRLIGSLNKTIENASLSLKNAMNELVCRDEIIKSKQTELMSISDWAQSMKFELDRRDREILDNKKIIKKIIALFRGKLAKSKIGDVVRWVKDYQKYIKQRVFINEIRSSVEQNKGRLIIAFPVITWNFRIQRPQHIVTRLRDNGYSVLYVAISMTAIGRMLRSSNEALSKLKVNLLSLNIFKLWLNSKNRINIYSDQIEGEDLYNITLGLESIIAELNPSSITYLIQFPGWASVAINLKKRMGGKIVFDCMDDHAGFTTNTHEAIQIEKLLIENADLVIASSDLLENKVKKLNPNTIQVKNGTEFDHFANSSCNGVLDYLSSKPIIGYYGAISDWFDTDIVAYCARRHEDWNFVLIGDTTGANLKPIENLSNVHLIGEIPYKELPGYLAYFDVCTIPFKIIPLTLATNPVKFYEYISAGKPVVSVELPELEHYADNCYLAKNAEDFCNQLEIAMSEKEDGVKITRRINLAKENSWDVRVKSILDSDTFN